STSTSAVCGPRSIEGSTSRFCIPWRAPATSCMRQPKLLRTSTFQLAVMYALLFAGSVLILMYFMHWATVGYMERQTEETIDAEITGLQDQYRAQGLTGLVRAINERIAADPASSALYLFTAPDFRPLAGNLAAWPGLTPEPAGWFSFIREDLQGHQIPARARVFT